MAKKVNFSIDGKKCSYDEGAYLVEAARENDVFIPTLCNLKGIIPKGSCRICSVNVNGKLMTACTTRIFDGMEISSDTEPINNLRKSIVEMLFVEGNHFCPSCDKSGKCELQALAYFYKMDVPRFPYQFPRRSIDSSHPKILKDHNRCILCKRCIRGIKDENGKSIFTFLNRGHKTKIYVDPDLAENLTDELAEKAVDICPVGAIMKKGKGFNTPIGNRKYDRTPISEEVQQQTEVGEQV